MALPWTQITHVEARLWINDIEIRVTKCDTKRATAEVRSLQNEWTKAHWADCVRVGGRYQLKGCWFVIETMSVANDTLVIAPSGPPKPVQLSLQEAMEADGEGGDDDEEETTATITANGETLPFPTTRQLHSYLSRGREESLP